MKDKVLRFFKSNSVLKVISVLLALVIWVVIVSVTNPLGETSLRIAYTLGVEGASVENTDGTALQNIMAVDARVEVSLKGREESLSNITNEDISISLDLSEVKESGLQDVPVVVKSDKVGVNVVDYSPKTIPIRFEKIVEATFPVSVLVDNDVLPDDYVIAQTVASPSTIQLRGFESLIKQISTVQVHVESIDIDAKIDQTRTLRMICKYYDAAGKEITEFNSVETVDVTVTAGKMIPLKFSYTGIPTDDCYVKETSITPQTVIVVGSPSVLSGIGVLETNAVVIDGISEDLVQMTDVILPPGVMLADSSIRPTVTIRLGGIVEKSFSVNRDNVTMRGAQDQYVYTVNGISDLILRGKDSTLDAMEASSLRGSINVSGLGVGTHRLQVSVSNLPSELSIPDDGYAYVDLTIREAVVDTPAPTVTTSRETETPHVTTPSSAPTPTLTPTSTPIPTSTPAPTPVPEISGEPEEP